MGVKIGVTVKNDRADALLREIAGLTKLRVMVGIPAESADRDPQDGDKINNAELLYIMENGAPAANIPARKTLGPGVAAYKPRAIERFKLAGRAAMDAAGVSSASPTDVKRVPPIVATGAASAPSKAVLDQLNAIGLEAVASVKKQFVDGNLTPLKPATIAARKRDGFQGEKPLIRTSDLMRHISFVIRKVK